MVESISADTVGRIQKNELKPWQLSMSRITLVCDNLNTHCAASRYAAFSPAGAFRILRRLEIVHTPKYGSWLNMAEPELRVMPRQCFADRVVCQDEAAKRIHKWSTSRNDNQAGTDWQFATSSARIKLKRLYPKIESREPVRGSLEQLFLNSALTF